MSILEIFLPVFVLISYIYIYIYAEEYKLFSTYLSVIKPSKRTTILAANFLLTYLENLSLTWGMLILSLVLSMVID